MPAHAARANVRPWHASSAHCPPCANFLTPSPSLNPLYIFYSGVATSGYDIRVAKGRGDRGYESVRISVRSHSQLPSTAGITLLGTTAAMTKAASAVVHAEEVMSTPSMPSFTPFRYVRACVCVIVMSHSTCVRMRHVQPHMCAIVRRRPLPFNNYGTV